MSKFTMTKEQELGLTGPVKAIAMLVIVFYHACALYTGAWFGEPATPCPELGVFVQWLATVHVPLFLLVSGYIWAYLKMETHKYDDSCVVLKKKVRRLLVPYTVVSLVWAGPVFCLFYGGAATVRAFILGGNPSQLWFLLALFWMFALAEFLWRAVPRWLGNLPALLLCASSGLVSDWSRPGLLPLVSSWRVAQAGRHFVLLESQPSPAPCGRRDGFCRLVCFECLGGCSRDGCEGDILSFEDAGPIGAAFHFGTSSTAH